MRRAITVPNILYLDLETGFNAVLAHRLFNKGPIPYDGLLTEKYIITACYAMNDGPVKSVTVDPERPHDDLAICAELKLLLDQADYIVAHYGKRFDVPFLRARMLQNGFSMREIPVLDTKFLADKYAFNSKRLDYLTKLFFEEGKAPSSQQLWIGAYHGDPKAIRDMVKYCKQDVKLLRSLFLLLRAVMHTGLNYRAFNDNAVICRSCGGELVTTGRFIAGPRTGRPEVGCTDCGLLDTINRGEVKHVAA